MASKITVTGQASVSPASGTSTSGETGTLNLGLAHNYSQVAGGSVQVNGTDANPFILSSPNVGLIRFLSIRALDGQSFKVGLTSALGTNQQFRLSDLLVLHTPNVGDELVEVRLVGTGLIEYKMAGEPNGSSPPFVPPPQTVPTGYFDTQAQNYVRYVAPFGLTTNNGYDWRTPMKYIMDAINSLPLGGTIHIMGGSYCGGDVQGQGIWMSGSATTYPGVARLYVPETGMHRGFTLLGYTGGPVNSNPQQAWPTAQVMGGKPTDTSRPPDRRNVGLWVTNNSGSPLWVEGLNFQLDFCVPIRLGVDQNPSIDPDDYTVRTNRGTAQTTDVVMIRNCSVLTNNGSGRDVGPGIDMGYCLWTVIEECSLIRPSDIPLDSDRRAAILVRPSEGTSPLTVRKCRAAQGGIRYYAGSSIWHFDVDGFEVESDNEALPPLFEGFSLNSAGYGYLRDLLGADDSTSQPRIRLNHDGSLRPHQVVVHDCGNQVVGPCTNYGGSAGYGGGVIENGGQTLAGLGQFGFASGELTADTLAGRFASPVISNRHYNLWPYHDGSDGISGNVVPQPNGSSTNLIFTSSYWGQAGGNGTLVNSPIADRRGGNTAFQISGLAGDTPEWDWIYAGRPTLQAGDTYLFNFWVRYPNTIPLTGMHTAQLSISQFGSGTAVFERRNLDGNGFLIPKISGNKEWQHYSGYVKLVSFTGTAVFTIQFLAFGSANNPCQFDEVSLIRMPGDQFDQNEIGAQEQNMVGFVQAPAGAGATTQPGQKLLAQGGLGVGNAVAATTPGSVVKKMQLFDGAGNAIGWVPIYSTIT